MCLKGRDESRVGSPENKLFSVVELVVIELYASPKNITVQETRHIVGSVLQLCLIFISKFCTHLFVFNTHQQVHVYIVCGAVEKQTCYTFLCNEKYTSRISPCVCVRVCVTRLKADDRCV